MKKIFFGNKYILFCDEEFFDTQKSEEFSELSSVTEAKLELISNSTKPIAMVSPWWEISFAEFTAQFPIIDAAGGVVKNNKGELLMIYRYNHWDLPKGKLEVGEEIAQCAVREVEEECGISDLTIQDFRGHTYHIYKLNGKFILKRVWWWNMYYKAAEPLTPQTEEDISIAEWVSVENIEAYLKKSYATIVELLSDHS